MLRKIIRAIIPALGEIFFNLFVEGAENVHQTANIFANIISAKDKATETQLSSELRQQRQRHWKLRKSYGAIKQPIYYTTRSW